MNANRRTFLKGIGGSLAIPILEQTGLGNPSSEQRTRFLVVGNPFGMHPEYFFPADFGKDFSLSPTLDSLKWAKDRITILSHTDHSMKSGHGREVSFLNGVLPETSAAFPEKNMSLDQIIARHTESQVRFPSVHASLDRGIRMCWNANGVDIKPFVDPRQLYEFLFLNSTAEEKRNSLELIDNNKSILDTVRDQYAQMNKVASRKDQQRLDQYATSIRELESNLAKRKSWIDKDKPTFDISEYFSATDVTIYNRYNAIFDMIAFAFQTDLTRVASISFSPELKYTDVKGVSRSYHGCTHNGKKENVVDELLAIESFQISQLARFMKKLDDIPEPNSNGSMLDHTVILFGSGMGYGGTHSNRNLPILVAGGGLKHQGHVDTRDSAGNNMPLCNLFVALMQRFGIERDKFNTSTGKFDLAT